MKTPLKIALVTLGGLPVVACAQVPDLVAAFDAGGRAMGMGGVTYITGSDTLSGYYNPAGLGFITRATLGLTIRNLPESTTVVTGDIGPTGQQRLNTEGEKGPTGLSHAGLAFPLQGRNGGTNGTIAVTLTKGGVIRDSRVAGPGLVEGGLGAGAYNQLLKINTDFVNVSYGRMDGEGTFNWGFGLVYAMNRQSNFRSAPSGVTNFDETANGLGFQAGLLLSPKSSHNTSFGVSFRSPIKLRGGNNTLIYPTIPGRIAAGLAFRQDGLRGGRDYAVYGVELQHFFGGSNSQYVDRQNQSVLGVGVEYNYASGGSRIPVRLGYSFAQAGGDFFGSRNSLTFGLGYRPSSNNWALDLNWGRPQGGGSDLSLNLTYKFGK